MIRRDLFQFGFRSSILSSPLLCFLFLCFHIFSSLLLSSPLLSSFLFLSLLSSLIPIVITCSFLYFPLLHLPSPFQDLILLFSQLFLTSLDDFPLHSSPFLFVIPFSASLLNSTLHSSRLLFSPLLFSPRHSFPFFSVSLYFSLFFFFFSFLSSSLLSATFNLKSSYLEHIQGE